MSNSTETFLEGRFFGEPGSWFVGRNLLKTITADRVEDVLSAIQEVEELADDGFTCAGFVSFEASPGFNDAVTVKSRSETPLVWFQCYEAFDRIPNPFTGVKSTPKIWRSSVTKAQFTEHISRIKEYMASGDTYQVNYTFRLVSSEADGLSLMARLAQAQPDSYCAYFDTGDFQICTVSPELFLRLDGNKISTKPMKGTRQRGRTEETDEALISDLRTSLKDQAENLMIVDMARNDLGRVADVGSVSVPNLFSIETHETLHQMTSEVHASSSASLSEILEATFPPASITGAPKVRTMEIINELETTARSLYTGCIGVLEPGRKACFSVAIRTAIVDKKKRCATYGVGAGIVWDSLAENEWEECLLKGEVLGALDESTKLIETLRYEPSTGYSLLERHLDRLLNSSHELGFVCEIGKVREALVALTSSMQNGVFKVRLLLSSEGQFDLQSSIIEDRQKPLKVGVLENVVSSFDLLLKHKTTRREFFDQALATNPEWDEVILTNEKGEVTEGCTTNVLVEIDGVWYTPPVSCGLLPGTFRQMLIDQGEVAERVLTAQDLLADKVQVINSVRGRVDVDLVSDATKKESLARQE